MTSIAPALAQLQEWDPKADARAVFAIDEGRARISVLTDRLFRLEWSKKGEFEDRASIAIVNRRLAVPELRVEQTDGQLTLDTGRARLFFSPDGKPFHQGNLRVEFDHQDGRATAGGWRPGDDESGNLGGTIRTLDNVDGPCEVEPGILSRDGWALVDDSGSIVLEPGRLGFGALGWPWPTTRVDKKAIDWYLFAHGRDYQGARRDFAKVSGPVPLPPKHIFGSWWSRYWPYKDTDLKALVGEFRARGVPLDVLVIDMDWHKDGWTGYSWNEDCFPDPDGFLEWARGEGLKITLNLHPADGVGDHEEKFAKFAKQLGHDPKELDRVPFDCTDRSFVDAYFRLLHHPLESQGVDFWWMDWQQGEETGVKGLDPLIWLNVLHWLDLEERAHEAHDLGSIRMGRRPVIFSRWGGLGNHRYPIGFSGDTHSTWASLAWQPEFTSMAGNVGFAYWSHDIGGHQPGPVDEELYVRWVQYGALSPVLRTHTANNPLGERRIWAFGDRAFEAMREAFRLRYALMPSLYTAARRTFDDMTPMCAPLYDDWPELDEAYEHPAQYLLGDQLMVAPVVRAGDSTSRSTIHETWIPPGTWIEWTTGRTHEGPGMVEMITPIEEIPILVRAGGIVVTADAGAGHTGEQSAESLTIHVFAGERGEYSLYEDDGESNDYREGSCAWTRISMEKSGRTIQVRIEPRQGAYVGMPSTRTWKIRLHDHWAPEAVALGGEALPEASMQSDRGWWWDENDLAVVIRPGKFKARDALDLHVQLCERDEAPLRAGVRGRMRMLGHVRDLLGALAPPTIVNAGDSSDLALELDPWTSALEIEGSGAKEAVRLEAICRILGVGCDLAIEGHEGQSGHLLTAARACVLHDDPELRVRMSLGAEGTWLERVEDHAGATALDVRTTWKSEEVPQRTVVRAELSLSKDGESIGIPFRRTVLPSINGWWILGPFKSRFGPTQLEKDFGVEPLGDERGGVDLTAPVRAGKKTRRCWQRVVRSLAGSRAPEDEFFVDLNLELDDLHEHVVAYALTNIDSPRAGRAILALGSDDGVVVWVNGEEVHRHQIQRGYGSMQDRIPIELREGENEILLKIGQAGGAWGFGAHLLSEQGEPLEDVVVRLEPSSRGR